MRDRERDRAELAVIHQERAQRQADNDAASAWYNAHQAEPEPEIDARLVHQLPVPDYGNPIEQAQAIRDRAAQPTPMDEFSKGRGEAGITDSPWSQSSYNDRRGNRSAG